MPYKKSISVSLRAAGMRFSSIRNLYPLVKETTKKGIKVYRLNIGQPDLRTPQKFYHEIKNFSDKTLTYAPSEGCEETTKALQEYYKKNKIPFFTEDIVVTTGGSEAIVFALMTVTDPKDEVIVFEPLYANYITFAKMASIVPVAVQTKIADGFHLPSNQEIEKKLTKKTKAIIICNPNNPTGTVYTKTELARIVKLAQKHNLFIISDEVYREIVFDRKALSITNFKEALNRIILVDSVSKRFNVCGARIGCVASKNKEVMQGILKFAQGRLSSPTIEQRAIIPLLKDPERFIGPMVREYKRRRDCIVDELGKIPGVYFYKPEGALYLIVRLPISDAEDFCRWLLEDFNYKKETVMFAPASGFYETRGAGKNEIRIAYVLSISQLKKAMKILRVALQEYKKIKLT